MTCKNYLKNLFIGLLFMAILVYGFGFREPLLQGNERAIFIALSFLSCLLFPFSRQAIEVVALKFTTRESWNTGFYQESPAKNGLYAFYYGFCFIVAIPIGCLYLIYLLVLKKAA